MSVIAAAAWILMLSADPSPIDVDASLQSVSGSQGQVPEGTPGLETVGTGGSQPIRYEPSCDIGGDALCFARSACVEDGYDGFLYDIYRGDTYLGQTCVTDAPGQPAAPVLTPARIEREFRALDWPASDLQVQPTNGRTLVNLPTNLFTTNTEPHRRTLTLLGQRITIEATAVGWTWSHGDGTTRSTTAPGRGYPHLDLAHTYTTPGRVSLGLTTTYEGRYRLGNGPWSTIPATLDVVSPAATLRVGEARPVLSTR